MSKYTHTSAAGDWFFVVRHADPTALPSVHRLALWATREDGSVTGLIAITRPMERGASLTRTTAAVVEPPLVNGEYKHLSQLTEKESYSLAKW